MLRSPVRAAVLVLVSALPGCAGAPKEAASASAPVAVATPPGAAENPPAGGEAGASSAVAETPDAETAVKPPPYTPFGLPECDNFLIKYQACVEEKVPAEQRSKFEDELRDNRTRWWKLAGMQQGTVAVGVACRIFAQGKKGDLAVDFGCEF